jgi:cytochrome P450
MRETTHSVTADIHDPVVAGLMAELATPAGQADPYPVYSRLRAHGDPLTGPDDSLIVTGYRHCSALLREPRLRKNPGRLLVASGFPNWEDRPALRLMFRSMLMTNPPEHTRLRGVVSRVFTARRVAELRPAVQAIAERLLDGLSGEIDFIEALAFPYPVTVIGELLGVPESDRPRFRALVDDWTAVLDLPSPPVVDHADLAASEIIDYFAALAAERRARPREDLISALVSAGNGDGPALSDEEVVSTAALILAAGFETTTGLLANGLVALLGHPEQAERLRHEPELAKTAVDELLRYDSPVQVTYGRTAVDDIMVGDLRLHSGQRVITLLGAANRDPSVFHSPDELILDRDEGIPLSFGAGIHHCLGAALARLEGQVMIPRLLRRFPRLALAGAPVRRDGITIHGYRSMPVTVS